MEDPEVFAATHATVLRLLAEGVVDGLRVDHPDGLADPPGYLRRLHEATAGRWTVVEKILGRDEHLPADWPVAGTTGYDALRHLDGLFTDPDGAAELTAAYRAFTAVPPDRGGDWPATARRAAYRVITHELAAEVERLVRTAVRLCSTSPLETSHRLRDHAPWALRAALCEILVRLPVYRPYAAAGRDPGQTDAALLEEAAREARTAFAVPEEAHAVEVVRDAALGRLGDGPDQRDFCARFAQTASALRAKSVEDTAFYRYAPLLSATEVGGGPDRPAVTVEEFHAFCARLQRDWPATGTVLSTHDTKRSADVRARIAALSECPREWAELMDRLRTASPAPDPHVAWVAWQNAFGLAFDAGAPDAGRLVPALLKSVREAALRTTWTEPDAAYEAAVSAFVTDGPCGTAYERVAALAATLRPAVRATTLGATLLHLTMPGVPDVYMGTECVYAALVDPDNRRVPGEFGSADGGLSGEKLRLTRAALGLRRERPEWFGGSYEPLAAAGVGAEHCVAFARGGGVVAVATRLARGLEAAAGWGETVLSLPAGTWREVLTGGSYEGPVRLAELLGAGPVALLVRS